MTGVRNIFRLDIFHSMFMKFSVYVRSLSGVDIRKSHHMAIWTWAAIDGIFPISAA